MPAALPARGRPAPRSPRPRRRGHGSGATGHLQPPGGRAAPAEPQPHPARHRPPPPAASPTRPSRRRCPAPPRPGPRPPRRGSGCWRAELPARCRGARGGPAAPRARRAEEHSGSSAAGPGSASPAPGTAQRSAPHRSAPPPRRAPAARQPPRPPRRRRTHTGGSSISIAAPLGLPPCNAGAARCRQHHASRRCPRRGVPAAPARPSPRYPPARREPPALPTSGFPPAGGRWRGRARSAQARRQGAPSPAHVRRGGRAALRRRPGSPEAHSPGGCSSLAFRSRRRAPALEEACPWKGDEPGCSALLGPRTPGCASPAFPAGRAPERHL